MAVRAATTMRRFAALLAHRARGGLLVLGRGFLIAVGAVIAVIVVVALLDGFAPAQREAAPLAVLEPGEEHVSDQVAVTILSAAVTDDPDLFLDDGTVALLLELELTNRWTRPLSPFDVIGDVLEIEPVPQQEPDRAARSDDASAIGWLQPGVTTPIRLRWDVPADSVVPGDALRVTISDGSLRQLEVIGDEWVWDHHEPAARLEVPIEDRREGAS